MNASTSCAPNSLSSSGRTIGGRCEGCNLQIVRIDPPCTLCHSFFFFGYFSPGYWRRFSSKAWLVLTGIIGSITTHSPLRCTGGIGFGKHQPPASYWSWPSPSSMLRNAMVADGQAASHTDRDARGRGDARHERGGAVS